MDNVFGCLPRDASAIPDVPGVPKPVPSIQHTLKLCSECQCDIWVGPEQLEMYRAEGGRLLCFGCTVQWMYTVNPDDVQIVLSMLNPNEELIPRRI